MDKVTHDKGKERLNQMLEEHKKAIVNLNIAKINFNNATNENIDSTILYLNYSEKRVDELTKEIKFAMQQIRRNEEQTGKQYADREKEKNLAVDFFKKHLGGKSNEKSNQAR
jgi:hypothetical protein